MSYTEVDDSLMMIPDGSKHVVVFIDFNTKLLYNYKSCAFVGELL
jgi:hypothetical protein